MEVRRATVSLYSNAQLLEGVRDAFILCGSGVFTTSTGRWDHI